MSEQIKFTQELKDKWLTALRSGEYSQTSCSLKDEDGFCCLGVLCDILDPNGWNVNKDDYASDADIHKLGYAVYGESFYDEYMTKPKNLYSILPVSYLEFANRNDGDGDHEHEAHNFNEMADWIEENVPADG